MAMESVVGQRTQPFLSDHLDNLQPITDADVSCDPLGIKWGEPNPCLGKGEEKSLDDPSFWEGF